MDEYHNDDEGREEDLRCVGSRESSNPVFQGFYLMLTETIPTENQNVRTPYNGIPVT